MAPVEDGEPVSSPNRRQSLIHLAVFTSLLLPLACIPYIPIRRHLLGLKKSVHVLSNNTLSLQHELNTALLQARLLREDKMQLVDQLRDFQEQLNALRAQTATAESERHLNDKMTMNRLDSIEESTAQRESSKLRMEDKLKDQMDIIQKHVEGDRLPNALLYDMSASLADVASFIEEVEIQQGWSQSIPRDRGIDRMRQLALKLHTVAKTRQFHDRDTQ